MIRREIELARRAREAQFEREQYLFPAVLLGVDYLNSAAVARQPGHSWFQELGLQDDGEATPGIAFNRKAPNLPGLKVTVKRWPKAPYDYEVVDWDASQIKDLPGYTGTPLLPRHAQDHIDGYDPLILPTRNLSALRTYITPGSDELKVNVAPYAAFGGLNDLDLSGGQPASGLARYVLVYLAGDGTIQTVDGSTATDLDTAPPPKPDVPAGGIPSAYVRIDGDQVAIAEADIVEARKILDQGGGGSQILTWGQVALVSGSTVTTYTDLGEAVDAAVTGDKILGFGDFDLGTGQLDIDEVIAITSSTGSRDDFVIRGTGETQVYVTCEEGDKPGLSNFTIINASTSGDPKPLYFDDTELDGFIEVYNVKILVTETGHDTIRFAYLDTNCLVNFVFPHFQSFDNTTTNQRAITADASQALVQGGVLAMISGSETFEELNSGTVTVRQLPYLQTGTSVGSGWFTNAQNDLATPDRDVFPKGATAGLEARFRNLLNNASNIPAHQYHWSYRSLQVDDTANHKLGFQNQISSPYFGTEDGFTLATVANTVADSNTFAHFLRLYNFSGGTTTGLYLEWTNSTAKNAWDMILGISPLISAGDYHLGELRVWDVQSPSGSDEYWAIRWNYEGSTSPQHPLRVGLWYGTGVTLAAGDGTLVNAQVPFYAGLMHGVQLATAAGPLGAMSLSASDGSVAGQVAAVQASMPANFKTARFFVIQTSCQAFLDEVTVA